LDLSSDKASLDDLLRNEVYFVPRFQRQYAWNEVHCEFLWSDLVEATTHDTDHFMGSILVCKEFIDQREAEPGIDPKAVRYLIDGQQRLVTLLILLARLRDQLGKDAGDGTAKEAAEDIARYLRASGRWQRGGGASVERVVLNEDPARNVLQHLLGLGEKLIGKPGRPPAHLTRLRRASEFFTIKLEEYVHSGKDPLQILNTVLAQLFFVRVEVGSDSDAFTVFESLNARGAELQVADQVKNLVMGRAARLAQEKGGPGDLERDIDRNWSAMSKTINDGIGDRLATFLRHYWIAEHKFVREAELYRAISAIVRKEYPNKQTAAKALRAFSDALAEAAAQYVWLWTGKSDDSIDLERYAESRDRLAGISAFGATQVLPVLLTAIRHAVTPDDFAKLSSAAETAVIRRSLARQPGNEVEKATGGWCESIRENSASPSAIGLVIEGLLSLAAGGQTEDTLRVAEVNSERARHMLLRIENVIRKGQGKELFAFDLMTIDVEHILPKKPTKEKWPPEVWGGAETQEEMQDRLGNFALWASAPNRGVKNAPYNCHEAAPNKVKATCCKRHAYMTSDVVLTKRIAQDFDGWGPNELANRQQSLADAAAAIWPVPTTQAESGQVMIDDS
jgi:hypothetical protein